MAATAMIMMMIHKIVISAFLVGGIEI